MTTKKYLYAITGVCLLLAGSTSCTRIKNYVSSLGKNDENPPVARVYDAYLYKNDLPDIVPAGSSKEDSIAIIRKYIDSWATRQLILNDVQTNMPAGDLEKEMAEFRELLLTGRYEQQIISQRLDTTVTPAQIKAYYDSNKDNFILSKDIVCWSYLPVTYCEGPLLRKLRAAFSRDTPPRDAENGKPWDWSQGVEKVMAEESYNASLVNGQWAEVEALIDKYEIEDDFASSVRKNGYSFVARNSEGVYLGRITRFVPKGSPAPLEYVKHQMKSILLNRRMAETLKQAEAELKAQAEKDNKLEIFTQDENK